MMKKVVKKLKINVITINKINRPSLATKMFAQASIAPRPIGWVPLILSTPDIFRCIVVYTRDLVIK